MIAHSTGAAILALLITSLVVRVAPAFLGIRIPESVRPLLDRVLPLAVFINFAVYIVFSELRSAPLPAGAAIAVVGVLAFLSRAGLIVAVCAGALLYGLVVMVFG